MYVEKVFRENFPPASRAHFVVDIRLREEFPSFFTST